MIENLIVPVQSDGLWHFVCTTCATEDSDRYVRHEALTESRAFAHLCLAEHKRHGHDAEVLRLE